MVHEHTARASHLIVPDRAAVLKRQLLIFQIGDFDNLWNLIVDVCINTVSFIPFGFVLVVFLQGVGGRSGRFSLWWVVPAGFLLSLSIVLMLALTATIIYGLFDPITIIIKELKG